jgi:hypothetical protein
MRLTNEGDVPVSIAADARLLSLEVTERGARRPVHCELPADMRPGDDLERALVVPPKRSYVESFDPRLYCFSAAAQDALASGAIVVAHLGWKTAGNKPPFEVWPIDGVEPVLGPLHSVASPPIALPDEPTPALAEGPAVGTPRLQLTASRAVEGGSPAKVEIPVTLRNEGSRPVTVRFRPETLGFDVIGQAGVTDCAWPTPPTAPMRELFTTVPSGGTTTLSVLLGAYCGGHVLDNAGLLVVRPRLDTRKASGEPIGLRAFDGLVIATRPTLVRLHSGQVQPKLSRPALAP